MRRRAASGTTRAKPSTSPKPSARSRFDTAEFSLPVTLSEGSDALHGYLTTYYCEAEHESLCFIDDVRIEVPVTVSARRQQR